MTIRARFLLMVVCLVGWSATHLFARPCLAQVDRAAFELGVLRYEGGEEATLLWFKNVWETYVGEQEVKTLTPKYVWSVDPATKEKILEIVYVEEMNKQQVPVSGRFLARRIQKLDVSERLFRNLDGSVIKPKSLAERIKGETVVVVTYDGKPLPKLFAPLFRVDTVVISLTLPDQLLPAPPLRSSDDVAPETPQPREVPQRELSFEEVALQAVPATPQARRVTHDEQLAEFARWTDPPTFRLARIDGQDRFALREVEHETRTTTGYLSEKGEEDKQGAEASERAVVLTQRITTSTTTLLPPNMASARTVAGESSTAEQLEVLKQNEVPVVVSHEELPLDLPWLKVVKPETLVLRIPSTRVPEAQQQEPVQAVPQLRVGPLKGANEF